MYIDYTYIVFVVPALIIAMIAQLKVKTAYSKYSRVSSNTGLTGADVARRILDQNGLQNVSVRSVPGQLTDHYDPRSKTVNLSQGIYDSSSVAAISVAAHECGHAIQDGEEYFPLRFRSAMVPVVNIGSTASMPLILIGFLFSNQSLVQLGIILFSLAVAFQLVTLPVEFNASGRALRQLETGYISTTDQVMAGSKKMLTAAALTYVASALVAIMQLLRLVVIADRRNNN